MGDSLFKAGLLVLALALLNCIIAICIVLFSPAWAIILAISAIMLMWLALVLIVLSV